MLSDETLTQHLHIHIINKHLYYTPRLMLHTRAFSASMQHRGGNSSSNIIRSLMLVRCTGFHHPPHGAITARPRQHTGTNTQSHKCVRALLLLPERLRARSLHALRLARLCFALPSHTIWLVVAALVTRVEECTIL